MLDEIRDDDARPSSEEPLGSTTDPVRMVLKALALAAAAIAIGVSLAQLVMYEPEPAPVTISHAR